jgi:hypothetical protein
MDHGLVMHHIFVPGTLAGLILPAAGLPEVGHRGQLSIDGPPSKPEKHGYLKATVSRQICLISYNFLGEERHFLNMR